jgi:hypothetical protein
MKKKLMFLLVGVAGLFSVGHSQLPVVTVVGPGIVTNSAVPVVPGAILPFGSIVTYTTATGVYLFQVVNAPDLVDNGNPIEQIGTTIESNFNAPFAGSPLNILGYNSFGTAVNWGNQGTPVGGPTATAPQVALQFTTIPFDFGLSAVLGAGALAAVRTARRRRNESLVTEA